MVISASEKWHVFICYRQDDGKEAAQWLHDNLDDAELPVTQEDHSASPRLDVYFDQTAPAVEDRTAVHQPALQRAKALLFICSPGARDKLNENDWVHRELDWWLENRESAPIIIDPLGGKGGKYIPKVVSKRWPTAQQVPVGLELVVTRPSAVDNVHLNVLATEWLNS